VVLSGLQTTYLGRATHLKPPKTTSEPLTALLHLRSAEDCYRDAQSLSLPPSTSRKFSYPGLCWIKLDYPGLRWISLDAQASSAKNKLDQLGLGWITLDAAPVQRLDGSTPGFIFSATGCDGVRQIQLLIHCKLLQIRMLCSWPGGRQNCRLRLAAWPTSQSTI
jgi:hypothetical protein